MSRKIVKNDVGIFYIIDDVICYKWVKRRFRNKFHWKLEWVK